MILTAEQITIITSPIGAECPVGVDLRTDSVLRSTYYEIKDQRNAARTAERQKMNGTQDANPLPCWQAVKKQTMDVLSSKTKDLEIVAWLIEALLRIDGYAGLALGFQIAHEMVTSYWNDIYPGADEDGNATKLTPFVWLNGDDSEGTLAMPMSNVPILTLTSSESIALWQYKQSLSVDRISDTDKKKQRIDQGVVEMKVIEATINQTPASYFITMMNNIQQCLDNYQMLCDDFQTLCKKEEIPPSSNIKSVLMDILYHVKTLSREVVSRSQPAVEAVAQSEDDSNNAPVTDATVTDREGAMRTLLSVADYFRRTEPQSPLPYMLERAVRWGRMPLCDLLKEVILDERVRSDVFQLTGIEVNKETK